MNIYLLRHGIAMDKGEWKGPDSDRPLTKEGSRKMKKAAKGLRHLNLKLDWILTSPYRRAFDTATITAKELKLKKKVRIIKSLAADGDPKALVRYLSQSMHNWESVLLVGHEPYLSDLISVWIAGQGRTGLLLDKGGLAKLVADSVTYDKSAHLEWLLTPKILKNIN
jgi:phosphohistidine phosphatase